MVLDQGSRIFFQKKIKLPMFILQIIATGYVPLLLPANHGDFVVGEREGVRTVVRVVRL